MTCIEIHVLYDLMMTHAQKKQATDHKESLSSSEVIGCLKSSSFLSELASSRFMT